MGLVGLLVLVGCGGAEESASIDPLVIETTAGAIRGEAVDGLRVFRGVPYAAPPLGSLRWRPPQAHAQWADTRETISYGAACHQVPGGLGDPGLTSEDCLTLNIWAHADDQTRPVMVWIHGGGHDIGRSSDPMFDGPIFATDTDTVFVSINFRLGAFANLASPMHQAEEGANNLGIRDQAFALQWVADNIAAFGGDPGQVTVFGESAGGEAVCHLMAAPSAEGLLHRGIIQSGGGCYGLASYAEQIDRSQPIIDTLACTDMACLRELSATSIIDAQAQITDVFSGMNAMGPSEDGSFLVGSYWDRLTAGSAPALPIMTGANADEMALFLLASPTDMAAYEEEMAGFGANAEAMGALYPATTDDEAKEAIIAAGSDLAFICPAWAFAEHAMALAPIWLYHFDAYPTGLASIGAAHGVELFLLFGTYGGEITETELALGSDMRAAWGTFAHGQDPAPPMAWQPYDANSPSIGLFEAPPSVVDGIRDGRCEALRDLNLIP
jgi:para-nitrobenzyl esterase